MYGKNDEISQDLNYSLKQIYSSLNPPCLDYKKCECCGCLMIKFCKCQEFNHFKCIKNWIIKERKLNDISKETVQNYYFRIYKCREKLERDNNSIENSNMSSKNECNTYLPLKFKLNTKEPIEFKLNDDDEKPLKYKVGDIIDFYEIKKPENSEYFILESIDNDDSSSNSDVIKSIHVIKLTGEDIKIGRCSQNDVIVDDSSVCKKHAIIKYDKENEWNAFRGTNHCKTRFK